MRKVRDGMKMWIGGIKGNGELISAEKISIK